MAKKKKKSQKQKTNKKFDYDYCMKRSTCKFCKYERNCEQFTNQHENLNKILKEKNKGNK